MSKTQEINCDTTHKSNLTEYSEKWNIYHRMMLLFPNDGLNECFSLRLKALFVR